MRNVFCAFAIASAIPYMFLFISMHCIFAQSSMLFNRCIYSTFRYSTFRRVFLATPGNEGVICFYIYVYDRTGGVVDVYTIDKSQGQERDVIILSMVRSNAKGQLGFITDRRRITVALTRWRDGLIIVCNTRMLLADKRTWYSYLLWAKSQQVILTSTSGYNVKALTSYDMGGVATS